MDPVGDAADAGAGSSSGATPDRTPRAGRSRSAARQRSAGTESGEGRSEAPATVLLGLGSNLGDPLENLRLAVRMLREAVSCERISSVYRTEPIGHTDQPDFLNLVCMGSFTGDPHDLLRVTRGVEDRLGRVRSFRNAPRPIDIDLLDFAGRKMRTDRLTLPHPRLHERRFVLQPLAEIAPEWQHPRLRATAAELAEAASGRARVERIGPLEPGPARAPGARDAVR